MRIGGVVLLLTPLLAACRSPTQITFDITTNVGCAKVTDTSFTSGPIAALTDGRPSTAEAHGCDAPGSIGSVVVIPSGSDDDLVAVEVVTGVGVPLAQCGPGASCIVAKRALKYIPHTPLVVRIEMESACEGVTCSGDTTCEQGQCVSAIITNPTQCEGSGCTGSVLAPEDGGAPVTDAAVDATVGSDGSAAVDASGGNDSSSPADASEDAGGVCVPACSAPLVCERYAGPSCVDPDWAEWPMPNTPGDDPVAPNQRVYTDDGDGTVTDGVTGLMWQQATAPALAPDGGSEDAGFDEDGGPTYAQATAFTYCASLRLGGHEDWRLPSLIELVSILDWSATGNAAIDPTYFPQTMPGPYWSSTVVAGTSVDWLLEFNLGQTESGSLINYVRCVR